MMKIGLIILTAGMAANVFAQAPGTLDASFGTGGKVVTAFAGGQAKAYGVAVQPDGKIVVAGFASNSVTGKDFALVRYNTDGSLDNTFGTNGVVTTDVQLGSEDIAYDLALQTDGKIVLGGSSDDGSDREGAVVRYLSNGTLDATFGTNGIVLTDFDNGHQDEIRTIKVHQLTGNIIVGGSSVISSSVSKPVVARYTSNGTLDNTFNTTGIRLLWITSLDYQYLYSVEDLEVQSNGKISAVGWRDFPGQQWDSDYWACRINSDGTMDNTFSTDGVNTYNGGFNGHDRAYAMLLNSNNEIMMAGGGYISTLRYDFTFFGLTAAGSIGSLSAVADYGSLLDDVVYGLAKDNNGRFVLAGSSGSATNKTFGLYRITATAAADNAFGASGKVTTTFGSNLLNECFDVAIQADNKIVAAGYAGNDFAIARYLGDAQPDLNTFQLITPANAAVNQSFTSLAFDWSDAYGATSYEITIDLTPAFASPQTHAATTSSYTATNLLPNTQYYWKVRASDGTNWGNSSATWSFTTNALENFTLLSPSNNATNQQFSSLAFDWTDVAGASSYELQLDIVQTFTGNPQVFTATSSAYTATNLLPSQDYYWRVRANGASTWGQWSNSWHFVTTAQSTTSVGENTFAGLKIFPNPANELLYIQASELEGSTYTLTDAGGRIVLAGKLEGAETVVQLGCLQRGTYLLKAGDRVSKVLKL